jgi:uncharacterized protein YciI
MFALLLTPAKTLEDLKPVQAEHEQYLQKYDASGTFILRGGLTARVGGFLLANVTSEAELKAIIAEDPYVREQVANYEIIGFKLSKFNDCLAPLLATSV